MGKLLTLPEVAERIRCSHQMVYYYVRQGYIPVVKFGGRLKSKILVDEDDLEQYLTDCKFRYKAKVNGDNATEEGNE